VIQIFDLAGQALGARWIEIEKPYPRRLLVSNRDPDGCARAARADQHYLLAVK
jgi:hypothetical protein